LDGKLRGTKVRKGKGKFDFNPCLGEGGMGCINLVGPSPLNWQANREIIY